MGEVSGARRRGAVSLRVEGEALHGVRRGEAFEILVDGEPVVAYAGETIAAALLGRGQVALRLTPKKRRPRGIFCGIGVCFDCLVVVDGVPNVRACVTPASPGMRLELFGDQRGGLDGARD